MSIERWISTIPLRLRSIFRRSTVEAELDEELRGHLERLTAENVRLGLSPTDALHAARRTMHGMEQAKEECRDARRVNAIDEIARDLRYAARILRKSPTFTIVATLTLALGVGINATMFSIVDAVVLRALPFDEPSQLVRIFATKGGAIVGGPSALDVRDVARMAHSFERVVAYDEWRKNVSIVGGSGQPEQMIVGLAPKEYFETLRVAPMFGRMFTDDENRFGNHYVAAISNRLWQDRFGGARDVIGRMVRINDEPYTIVAVMPDAIPTWLGARGIPIMIWTPFAPTATMWSEASRRNRDFMAIARLRPGVTVDQAREEVSRLGTQLAATFPVDRPFGLTVVPLADTRIGALRPILVILGGAVALVLMIACANLANLLFARNATRQRELLLRTALGAGRGRLVRQLLVETLVVAALGGAAGLALSVAGCAAVARWHPAAFPQLTDLAVNGRVLAFALVVSLVTGLGFGVGPAWSTSRIDLATALRSGGRTATSAQSRARSTLVIAETALALMLVVATALLAQSVMHLQRQDLGFPIDHLLKAHVYLPPARYPDSTSLTRFADQFGAALRRLPGVRGATVVTGYPPVNARWVRPLSIEGEPPMRAEDAPTTFIGVGDEWYFRTLGIPLLRGRDFASSDAAGDPPVGIVNETFARQFFPRGDVLGRRVRLGFGEDSRPAPRPITIVGVFRDAKNDGLASPPRAHLIGLYRQLPEFNIEFKDIVVRSSGDPHALAAPMRATLAAMDPDMPLAEVATMEEVVASAAGGLAYVAYLLASFAALGLSLAAIGIYGVVAYGVTQRTAEIGVRMAIGATPSGVLWFVVRRGLALGLIGATVGIVGSIGTSRVIAHQMFGISAVDPMTFSATGLSLVLVASLASLIPAWRATRIDPVRALRGE